MRPLAVIKITRAIRRLSSAITPGTSPEWRKEYLGQAVRLIMQARDIERQEAEKREAGRAAK